MKYLMMLIVALALATPARANQNCFTQCSADGRYCTTQCYGH